MTTATLVLEFTKILVWPATMLLLIAVFYRQICDIVARIHKADLPGGFSLEVKAAKALSAQIRRQRAPRDTERKKAGIPLTQANAAALNKHLGPSPSGLDFSYYRELAEQDPNLALAGLRIEIETLLKNYARGHQVEVLSRESAGMISRKLYQAGVLGNAQYRLIADILNLCNLAVHGRKVSQEDADDVIDISQEVVDEYLEWLDAFTPKKAARKSA